MVPYKLKYYRASTHDGVTFRSLLARAVEGSSNAQSFGDTARQLSLGLDCYKAFKQHVTGHHNVLREREEMQYISEATDAITRFIVESVAADSKESTTDTRNYSIQHIQQALTLLTRTTAS